MLIVERRSESASMEAARNNTFQRLAPNRHLEFDEPNPIRHATCPYLTRHANRLALGYGLGAWPKVQTTPQPRLPTARRVTKRRRMDIRCQLFLNGAGRNRMRLGSRRHCHH